MDAVKFVEERRRMFAVTGENPKYSLFNMNTCAEDVVKEVEEWSAAHPRKTRQDEFLKQWPGTRTRYNMITIKPCELVAEFREANGHCARDGINCANCCKEFWMQEVE